MATLDIPKFYSKARIQCAVRHKITGQLLGYAHLLPNIPVDDGQLQLVPWQDNDLLTADPELAVFVPEASVNLRSTPGSNLNLETLPEEINLSDDGSRNATLASEPDHTLEHLPAKQADFNASLVIAKAPTSTPEPRTMLCGSPALSNTSETSTFSMKSSSSSIPLVSMISSVVVKEANDSVVNGDKTRSEAGRTENKRQFVGESDSERGSKTIKPEEKNEKIDYERRYDKFLEIVNEGSDSARDKKTRKVRCLLCQDGRVYAYGNMGRHIQSFHEASVVCEICHMEFNAKRSLTEHKKKVHSNQLREKIIKDRDVKSNDSNIVNAKATPQLPPPPLGVSNPVSMVRDIKNSISDLPSNKVSVTMTSDTVKGVSVKLGLEKDAKMKKAMRKFGTMFKVDYKSLKFFFKDNELTGKEVVGDMNGSKVMVYGELNNN